MWMMPLHLHVNKKSDYDDDMIYMVNAQKIISYFMQNNGPGIFKHDNARPHTTRK